MWGGPQYGVGLSDVWDACPPFFSKRKKDKCLCDVLWLEMVCEIGQVSDSNSDGYVELVSVEHSSEELFAALKQACLSYEV